MKQKIESIIFDCDGVLIDSEIIANRIEFEIKNKYGVKITLEEQLQKFVGVSFKDPIMIEELKRLPSHYLDLFHESVRKAYHLELKPIDGVVDTLNELTLPMCVASNSEADSLQFKLELTGLSKYFANAVFDGQMVKRGKPAPDLFLLSIEKMKWNHSTCIVIEDSVAGVKAAISAGLRVYGFLGGGHISSGHAEKLEQAGASRLIHNFREILTLGS